VSVCILYFALYHLVLYSLSAKICKLVIFMRYICPLSTFGKRILCKSVSTG